MSRVLVVEDSSASRTLTTFLLTSAGHDVIHAGNAEVALTLAHDARPDLVVMHIQLPGMDGLGATRLLKEDERTRTIPVIAVTPLATPDDEARIRAAGCDGYLAKPFTYREFLLIISAQLSVAQP